MKPDDFNTPALPVTEPPTDPLLSAVRAPVVDNTGKTDELSLAVVRENQSRAVHIPEPEKAPGKYQLEYVLDGEALKETHATVEQALASVRRLRVLGVTPATATL